MWDVRHEAVTTFYAEPVHLKTGQRVGGYQFERRITALPNFLEIDELTPWASEVDIRELFEGGRKAIVGASVHVSSVVKLEAGRAFPSLTQDCRSDADVATVRSILDIIVRRLDGAPSSSPEMLRLIF